MERLQSAIAKARAARQSLTGGAAAGVGPDGEAAAAGLGAAPAAGSAPSATVPPAAAAAPAARPAGPAPAPEAQADAAWAGLRSVAISDDRLVQNRIVSTGRTAEAVEFDKLRTRVIQRMQARGWTRLAITSPGPSCGKSTIALNLAFGLARQEGARVMLCEMDMRRPSFRRILGLGGSGDFSRVIAGAGQAEDHLVRARDNLAIGLTERVAASAELLHAPGTATALDELQARFRPSIMIFDLPPFKASDDAISFLDKTDCVLIIAAAGQTTIEELDDVERELSGQTQVLGVVLNKCRHDGPDGQYYYGE